MGVNNFDVNYQAHQLISEIHQQATGQKAIAVVDTASFVSVAQTVLATGYENTLNAIDYVLARTLVAVRPFNRKFKGVEATADRWGAMIRKISFGDRDPEQDDAYTTVDGQSVDPFKVKKPDVLVTRFLGSAVYLQHYTRYKDVQLEGAFENEASFVAFINGMLTHMSNEWEQWLEEQVRMTVVNFIGSLIDENDSNRVIHLLTEYNTASGSNLSAQDIFLPANVRPFFQWVYGRIDELTNLMTERSEIFHSKIAGHKVMRHTPLQYQRVYLLAPIMAQIKATVKSNTYHDDFLQLSETEAVSYWQDINSPASIDVTPSMVDANGAYTQGAEVTESAVMGVIFDRDAVAYNVYHNEIEPVVYNPAGAYFNIFHRAKIQYSNDMFENGLVLLLD